MDNEVRNEKHYVYGNEYMIAVDELKERLRGGETMQNIANDLGITKERVRQIIEASIPVAERERVCSYCNELIVGSEAYRRWMHEECAEKHQRELMAKYCEKRRKSGYEALSKAERIALEEYKKRNYKVSVEPRRYGHLLVVNGKVVKCRYSSQRKKGFTWGIRLSRQDDTSCDVYHFIGTDNDGNTYHWIVPAVKVGHQKVFSSYPPTYTEHKVPNLKYLDRWDILEEAVETEVECNGLN